jgi:nitrogen-specific signal transduction histidine kinase
MKLSSKILAAAFFPFLVIIGLYQYFSVAAFNKVADIFVAQAEQRLTHINDDLHLFFKVHEDKLIFLARTSPPHPDKIENSRTVLQLVLQESESIFSISAINKQAMEWLKIEKFPHLKKNYKLKYYFDSPIYQVPMLEMKTLIGQSHMHGNFKLPFFDLAVPVKDSQHGDITGVLLAEISFQGVQPILESGLPSEGKVLLFDILKKRIITQADDTRLDFSSLESEVINEALHSPLQQLSRIHKGEEHRAVSFFWKKAKFDENEFLLLYYQPDKKIYFLVDQLKKYNLYASLIGIILFGVASFFLTRIIIKPLAHLSGQIYDLGMKYKPPGGRDLEYFEMKKDDEVKQLRRIFHLFQQQLELYSDQLNQANELLEVRVKERTSELSRTFKELESEKDNLTRIIDAMEDIVYIVNQQFSMEYVNPACERELGAVDGKKCYEYLHDLKKPCSSCSMGQVLASETGMYFEKAIKKIDKIYDCTRTILNEPDGIILFLTMLHDITERKNAEKILKTSLSEKEKEMLLISEKLVRQEKLATIGQVSGSIAHELRNPLGAIRNAAYYLKRITEPQEAEKIEFLQLIENEVAGANTVISELLEMSRMKEPLRKKILFDEIVDDAVSRCRITANLSIIKEYDDHSVWGDKIMLRQVFINLVTNAAQACQGNGKITIKASYLDDNSSRISLMDNGSGVQLKDIDHIFEPLFTTKAKGTGLGLTICREIIKKHSGEISITSKPGQGMSVFIILPGKI